MLEPSGERPYRAEEELPEEKTTSDSVMGPEDSMGRGSGHWGFRGWSSSIPCELDCMPKVTKQESTDTQCVLTSTVAKGAWELLVLLPLSPEFRGYRHMPLCPV